MSVNPSIERFFGSPVVDWSQPRRDPWPQDAIFEYCPTDPDTGLPIEPCTPIYDTYDKAIAAWFNTWLYLKTRDKTDPRRCIVNGDKPVPIVFASPDRAFGQAAQRLCPGKEINFDTPGAIKAIPLPFASLDMSGDPEFDRARWSNRRVRYAGISYDNREMLQYKYPTPINLTYQLSIWAKTKLELDQYTADFIRQFRGDELFIKVLHGNGFGIRCIPVLWEAVQQAVDLEPAQGSRVLRRVFQILVKGWIPHDPYTVRTVLRLDVEFGIGDPETGITDEVDGSVTINDVTDEVMPGGGAEGTRPLDGPFWDDTES